MINELPRHIPITAKISVIFGGFRSQFGWAFFTFGLLFFWIFGMNADVSSLRFQGEIIRQPAQISGLFSTGFEEGETTVFEVQYQFIYEGIAYDGASYTTGIHNDPGDSVMVEFPAGAPESSRIVGGRNAAFPIWVLFVSVFPLIGLVFIIAGWRRGIKRLAIMRNGLFAWGEMVGKEATNVKINENPVYKYTFRFTDSSGNVREITDETHRTDLVEDDNRERLLYDRHDPENGMLLDIVPGGVTFDVDGQIQPASPVKTAVYLILPLLALGGHGGYILLGL
jgi:hypothetical protein